MSYSRWIASKWYTYWLVRSVSGADCADKEVFEICDVASFTYQQLQERRRICLEIVCEETDCTEKELAELSGYMDMFCAEVDAYYKDLAKEKEE